MGLDGIRDELSNLRINIQEIEGNIAELDDNVAELDKRTSCMKSESVFVRGANPANETCLGCGKHVSRHYGLNEYRCHPREKDQEIGISLDHVLKETMKDPEERAHYLERKLQTAHAHISNLEEKLAELRNTNDRLEIRIVEAQRALEGDA